MILHGRQGGGSVPADMDAGVRAVATTAIQGGREAVCPIRSVILIQAILGSRHRLQAGELGMTATCPFEITSSSSLMGQSTSNARPISHPNKSVLGKVHVKLLTLSKLEGSNESISFRGRKTILQKQY